MSMSLRGRLETRIFLVLTVGVVSTLVVTALLPGATFRSNLTVLALMGVLGLGWELVYHGLQQSRWDRDWPSLFAALTVLNEGALLWVLTGALPWSYIE